MTALGPFLKWLGWRPTLINVYLVLLQHGRQTATEIMDQMTKSPDKSNVNKALKELQGMGAVSCMKGVPREGGHKWEAVAPGDFLSAKFGEFEDLFGKAAAEANYHYEQRAMRPQRKGPRILRGLEGRVTLLMEALRDAKERFILVDSDLAWVRPREQKLLAERAKELGVFKIMAHAPVNLIKGRLEAAGVSVVSNISAGTFFAIADDRVVQYYPEDDATTAVDNPALAKLLLEECPKRVRVVDGDGNGKLPVPTSAN